MKIAVLGTGMVGNAIATKLVQLRHQVMMGSRTANSVIDLGDISNSRGTEMFLALWVRLWGALGTPHFNIRVVREVTGGILS